MTLFRTAALAACLTLPALSQDTPAAAEPATEAPALDAMAVKKNISYYFGYSTGAQFARQTQGSVSPDDLDTQQFMKAFLDGLGEKEQTLSEDDLKATLDAFGKIVEGREKALGEENAAAEKTFLEENGKREGVTTTDSGLQYEVLEKGSDKSFATQTDEVKESPEFKIRYKGTLLDGTVFDESPGTEPVSIDLQVIEGFKETLTTMPIGSKWKVYMPSKLAYGEQRAGSQIGPNSLLIFELSLVDIVKAAPAPQPQFGFPPQQ